MSRTYRATGSAAVLVMKAPTPSACEPDRRKAVSAGPAASAGTGVQPRESETSVVLAGHVEHAMDV